MDWKQRNMYTNACEFARIYSLPTHNYTSNVCQFRRYSYWLEERNKFIKGFTKYDGSSYSYYSELSLNARPWDRKCESVHLENNAKTCI